MLAKYSPDLMTFMKRVDLEYPQYGQTMKLPFPETLESWLTKQQRIHEDPRRSG